MQVFDDFGKIANSVEEVVGHVERVAGDEADSYQSTDGVKPFQQI
jgi:hypothetical protein